MKTVSRRFKITLALGIGVISVFGFQALAKKPDTLSGAPVKRQWPQAKRLKNPDLAAFKKLLDDNEAIYCLTFRKDDSDSGTKLDNGGCTTSSSSVDDATRELILVAGGANVTQTVGFSSTKQALTVDAALY